MISNFSGNWESLLLPLKNGHSLPFKQKSSPSGIIAVFEGSKYIANFPGYTGNALTHLNFIQAATIANLGIICVTPKWSDSVDDMTSRVGDLFRLLNERGLFNISFVRGVSFGAQLSRLWISELSELKKIAWITPCSTSQLVDVGPLLDLKIKPASATQANELSSIPVKINILSQDAVVPTLDNYFEDYSTSTSVLRIDYQDHFTAGELPECSNNIVKWFLEE